MSPGVQYLLQRLIELEQGMTMMVEQSATKDARIAELEKSRRKPHAENPSPGSQEAP